eukprot:CAMPEP_0178528354 /NCGR_PEP_ID=MMETSP0696-20121128/31762_1 /TAXON_ID=265572 /ORGANISM="Extubocellulus spinifer, Strain CCMP396" /LENGTH=114 /DNA_ID=CAMNT_0020160011 /DNA_START=276 /DNA_END=621 /DNA_ORIENTATION=-
MTRALIIDIVAVHTGQYHKSKPHLVTAVATFSGSAGSSGGGALLVFTAQNEQPLVHVSPIIIMVAVAVLSGPPPQHSPILGHLEPIAATIFAGRCCCLRYRHRRQEASASSSPY